MNKKIWRYFSVVLLFVGLLLIRKYETHLFYDPLLNFFKQDYMQEHLPNLSVSKLIWFTFLRFFINSLLSIAILWLCFSRVILKFVSLVYCVYFLILIVVFALLLQQENPNSLVPLFYCRRFLIQPVLLLVLLPVFYVYRKQLK